MRDMSMRDRLHKMRNTEGRSVMEALVIFLYKMRSGSSNEAIAAIFDLPRAQQVSDIVDSVMKTFKKYVLPFHFGLSSRSREDLMETKSSSFVKKLYVVSGQLALIYDGTYIRIGFSDRRNPEHPV